MPGSISFILIDLVQHVSCIPFNFAFFVALRRYYGMSLNKFTLILFFP